MEEQFQQAKQQASLARRREIDLKVFTTLTVSKSQTLSWVIDPCDRRFIGMLSARTGQKTGVIFRTSNALKASSFHRNPYRTAAIEKQMQRLNTDFASTGISWTLASTTRTVNETWWFSIGSSSPEQTAMKQALRRGSRADLNIYSVKYIVYLSVNQPQFLIFDPTSHIHDSNNEALRGYATMPGDYDKNPKDDGVVFMIRTLPSPYGWLPNYNMGRVSLRSTSSGQT
jgi:hypothetical protein